MIGLDTPMVVVLLGAAGAGKSTLATRYPTTMVLCLDTYRAMVSSDGCDQEATSDAAALLDLVLDARCRRRLTSVIDGTNTDAPVRRRLVDVAGRHGMLAVALVVDTPLGLCLARQAARPGPVPGARWGRAVPAAVVTAQHTAIQAALPHLLEEGFAAVHRLTETSPEGGPQHA